MRHALFVGLLLAGCTLGRPNNERLGDQAWHAGHWADAASFYAAAGESPNLDAKLGDATLQGGALPESVKAWVKLGTAAPERSGEAAAGLARVAEAAAESGNQPALAAAIVGLRQVAPGWPLGRIAGRLGSPGVLQPFEAGEVIPALLAASPPRDVADAMLFNLARADRALGACPLAVPILVGVMHRAATTELRDSASTMAAACELGLGLAALDAGHPGEADLWFNRATSRAPDSPVGRRAMVGFGDARLREEDTVSARAAWQAVVSSPAPADTITQLALVHMRQIDPVIAGDSGTITPGRP